MKHKLTHITLALLLTTTSVIFAKEKTMSIQIRKGQLRSAPSYLSHVIENLDYATRVTVLEEKGVWFLVSKPGSQTKGWLNSSALTKKKLKISSGDVNATSVVSTEEQALAGKGFNSDVEAKFKKDNKDIDFTWVNKMEKIKIPTPTLIKFLKQGDIKPAQDHAQ